MQTAFTPEQLSIPRIAEANTILRKCVHCGFCTATCPTYALLGDELDSPRGRIYLIKNMLESGEPATEETVKHLDRCLSCLSCMTTCPSGVNYMHLVDEARAHVEETYNRPLFERLLRAGLFWSGLILLAPHHGDGDNAERAWKVWLARLRRFPLRGQNARPDELDFERVVAGLERLDFQRRMRLHNQALNEFFRRRPRPSRSLPKPVSTGLLTMKPLTDRRTYEENHGPRVRRRTQNAGRCTAGTTQ